MSRFASFGVSALTALLLAGAAFGAQGGFELDRSTWTEIALVLVSAAIVAVAVLRAPRGRLHGGLTLVAFAALAALCALSTLWSIVPDLSWREANLLIAYAAVFAAAVALARLPSGGLAAVLRGALLAAGAVVVYALASRVWPSIAADDIFARLGEPYAYWNALGATAALAVPLALWLGARRTGYAPANALAYPLISLLAVTIFLSYSRAAIIVAGIGIVIWLVFVPLRLRTVVLLSVSLATAAPVIVWALSRDAFTKNAVTPAVRDTVAPEFGIFLLATVLVALAAGLAIGFRVARQAPPAVLRLRVGVAAGVVACVVPVVLFLVLAHSDRGLGGTLKSGYESFVSLHRKTPGGPQRLLTASSSRGLYWHQAKQVFEANETHGTGADTFGIARLRYRESDDQSVSQHAHGYVQQTASDLGVIGLVVTGILLLCSLVAALRALGVRRRRRATPLGFGPERVGGFALALSALVYGLHSAVDWIWFVPGPTVMAVAAAGFLIGRGPLVMRSGALPGTPVALRAPVAGDGGAELVPPPPPPPVAARVPAAVGSATGAGGAATTTATAPPPPPPPPPRSDSNGDGHGSDEERTAVLHRFRLSGPGERGPGRWRRVAARGTRPAIAVVVMAAALLAAWAIWQPLRSDQQSDHALDLLADGKFARALAATDRARSYDPLTPRPYIVRSAVDDARSHPRAAVQDLERAVARFPGDPETWLQLSQYQLGALNEPAAALKTVRGALFLDPQSRAAQTVFFQANYWLHPPPPAPAPAVPAAPPAAPPSKPGD